MNYVKVNNPDGLTIGQEMKTYKELQAEIRELQAKAEKARQDELADAISDIKAKIQEYEITEADLFSSGKKTRNAVTSAVKPKYRNPETGETWAGRGKPPKWIAGKDKTQYLIK
jgi:DNA-binding protein H-NS